MGNSNGTLADHWDAIESTPGLQGGFIWEWWDHGLVQTTPGRDDSLGVRRRLRRSAQRRELLRGWAGLAGPDAEARALGAPSARRAGGDRLRAARRPADDHEQAALHRPVVAARDVGGHRRRRGRREWRRSRSRPSARASGRRSRLEGTPDDLREFGDVMAHDAMADGRRDSPGRQSGSRLCASRCRSGRVRSPAQGFEVGGDHPTDRGRRREHRPPAPGVTAGARRSGVPRPTTTGSAGMGGSLGRGGPRPPRATARVARARRRRGHGPSTR